MRIAADSHWRAGARARDGATLAFDTPGCLFRARLSPQRAGMRDEWMTEYYGAADVATPARSLSYAVGSDVVGPMGNDLVPLAPDHVDAFRRDHHAREIVAFDAVDADVLHRL